MNVLSKTWLIRRQNKAKELLTNHGLCVDLGSGEFPIYNSCLTIDVDKRVKPDVCTSIEHLPFKNNVFDSVFALEVLEHIENIDLCFAEISRILKNKGLLLISSPRKNVFWDVFWYLWVHSFGRKWLTTHKKHVELNKKWIIFKILKIQRVNFFLTYVLCQKENL